MSEFFRGKLTGKLALLFIIGFAGLAPSAKANVYATNIRLNGSTTNVISQQGQAVSINYILNEPASSGVTVKVYSGTNVVRSIIFPAPGPGTAQGLNTVAWDGLNNASNTVPAGTYTIRITAASSGYPVWTQLTDDDLEPNTYVWAGRGIAVDRNTNSLYYGRVFVANAEAGPNPATTPGDALGILKFNADTSAPDDGIATTGGHNWSGGMLGPVKVETTDEDRVYVTDLGQGGEVFSWDPTFSTNSLIAVLATANQPSGARLNGMALARQSGNMQLWMTDNLSINNGVLKWTLGESGACDPGDLGTTIVAVGTSGPELTLPPQDVAVDNAGNFYVCQSVTVSGDPIPRVFRFPAYDPATNSGAPELIADWAVGGGNDTYGGAAGIAVDPTGTYVAVSFEGVPVDSFPTNGNTTVLYATNGLVATNIDINLSIQGFSTHQDTDCAWDAVGNLYYIDNFWARWRAISPPGTNQATTMAPAAVQIVAGLSAPQITGITVSNGVVRITFSGATNDPPAAFTLLSAGTAGGPFVNTAGATIGGSNGVFFATTPTNGAIQFYRIQR